MTLTEEQGGFDLEKARASIAHFRIENPSNVDTESALKELVDQANLAEDALAEIERLRPFEMAARDLNNDLTRIAKERDEMATQIKELKADLEQAEICIRARMECIDDQAAYIKELESSLDEAEALTKKNAELMNSYLTRIAELEDAHKRSGVKYAKIINELRSSVYAKIPSLQKQWDDVLAEDKIGPDARPRSWQITEERMRAIRLSEELAWDCKVVDVLRAMLEEAGL